MIFHDPPTTTVQVQDGWPSASAAHRSPHHHAQYTEIATGHFLIVDVMHVGWNEIRLQHLNEILILILILSLRAKCHSHTGGTNR